MTVTSFYPVVTAADVAAAARFYRDHLGFEVTFEADWYVSLRLERFELAVLASQHPTLPAPHRALPAGVLLNVEVDDVDALHDRLVGAGVRVVLPLRDEDFGQRHAIFAAPDGVLLDVIQPIPPAAEYAAAFAADQAEGASTPPPTTSALNGTE
jgi:catechol 2,3-dioxygenase-like lactoylglutathione lyase family enzyme